MKKQLNIIGHKYIYLSFSAMLILASIIAVSIFSFNPGIDFVGGTLWQIKVNDSNATIQSLDGVLSEYSEIEDLHVQKDESAEGGFIIRMKNISEEQHQEYVSALQENFGEIEESRFESIGPTVGNQLKDKAVKSSIFVLLAISLYIAFAFRKVSYPVKSWKYGIITLITLFHDVVIPMGILSVLGHYYGAEMNTNFVVALLVIMGFSVHDTIVVFDRIRENLLTKRNTKFSDIVNESVNQTITRSINTSLTLVVVLVTMLVVGAGSLGMFVLTMLIGTIAGTYSSIFVAAPLLTIWEEFGKN